jgi:hypothetical protein
MPGEPCIRKIRIQREPWLQRFSRTILILPRDRPWFKATNDKDWIVRAAAVEAIAQRGDPSLLPKVQLKFSDKNPKVRHSAAAAVIRLSEKDQVKTARNNR